MREIKFRAWDTDSKSWIPLNKFYIFGDGSSITSYIPSVAKIMQYTGLKDKNGTEIYEGDVVTANDGGEYFPIDWDEEGESYPMGKYIIYWAEAGFWLKGAKGTDNPELEYSPWDTEFEVIGNIYENPELAQSTQAGEVK